MGSASMLFKRVVVAALIPAMTGCGSFWRPYLNAPRLDDDVENGVFAVRQKAAGAVGTDTPAGTLANAGEDRFATSIDEAFAAANDQRNLYLSAVNNHAMGRSIASSALYVLSAWTVYKGLSSDIPSAKRNVAIGTIGGATTYAFGNWFSNPHAEAAYLQGYRGVTCAMWQIRPYLIPSTAYVGFGANVATLGREIRALQNAYETVRAHERQYRELSTKGMERIQIDFRLAESANKRALVTLAKAQTYSGRVDTAGFSLRRRVELIAATVNEEVQKTAPDLEKIDAISTQFANQIARTAQALKPDPLDLRDEQEKDGGEKGSTDKDAGTTGSGTQKKEGDAAANSPQAAAAPGGAIDTQIAGIKKTISDTTKKQGTSSAALKKEIDALKTQVAALQRRPATSSPSVDAKAEDVVTKNIEAKVNAYDFATKRINLTEARIELLHATQIVNVELQRAASMVVSRSNAQCRLASDKLLTISPDVDDVSMEVNSEKKFTIFGGEGVPHVYLNGDKGKEDSDSVVKMSTDADNGKVSVSVKTGKAVPTQPAYLLITDGLGKQKEEITIRFVQPKKEEAKKDDDKADPKADAAPAKKAAAKPKAGAAKADDKGAQASAAKATAPADAKSTAADAKKGSGQ